MAGTLTSQRHKVADLADAMELCFSRGWTDGLPVIPPTEDRVRSMLEAVRLEPSHQVAFLSQRAVSITAEKVAINAVMAGCRPEYMPVVVAAVEGIGDPLSDLDQGPSHIGHRDLDLAVGLEGGVLGAHRCRHRHQGQGVGALPGR